MRCMGQASQTETIRVRVSGRCNIVFINGSYKYNLPENFLKVNNVYVPAQCTHIPTFKAV